jgi:hypothetical protein
VESEELTPAQRAVLAELGATPDERPRFDPALRDRLRAHVEADLAAVAHEVDPQDPVIVTKHALAMVHGCEARYLAEQADPFAWTVPMARGVVAHKAIELSVHLKGEPDPLDLVDESLARLAEDDWSLGQWLRTLAEIDLAELRSIANDRVSAFLECFPPLKSRWRPVTESRVRAELLDGRVVLTGKVDLTLGRAEGSTAGKVLLDLKTGRTHPQHREDLRFYALLETIRIGTPPRRVASYYLDRARFEAEDVNEDLLFAAAERLLDGAGRMIELGQQPTGAIKRTGPACRWCPLLEKCEEGRRHLDDADEASGIDTDLY